MQHAPRGANILPGFAMNQDDRKHIEEMEQRLASSVGNLAEEMRDRARAIYELREKDRDSAKLDNDRRHDEIREDFAHVFAKLDGINGRVRENEVAIANIKGKASVAGMISGVISGIVAGLAATFGIGS